MSNQRTNNLIGKRVSLLFDKQHGQSRKLPRGMIGEVVETYHGRVRVRFDLTQGIVGARHTAFTTEMLYHDEYVEVTT